jgi:hypothetical protein
MTKQATDSHLRIVVLGYVVRGPVGGLTWHHLQYVLGLKRLGHDVYFVEDSDDYPSCYDPSKHVFGTDPTYGLRYAASVFERTGLPDRWAFYDAHAGRWHGPRAERVAAAIAEADLLLNISGINPLRPWMADVPARALVDTDPVFTQVENLNDPARREFASGHTSFFTFGENFGERRCAIPDDGLPWQATRQPVVLDVWPVTPGPARGKLTTVMQWDSYKARDFGGQHFGMKSESFRPYMKLPSAAGRVFELALGNESAPREELVANGWLLRDPLGPTRDPWTYQRYIQQSKAEFGVAKHGYVVSRSGWFSERSAAYLASGRPALVQDTGFSDWLVTGAGVIPFSTPEEALAGVEEINARYDSHCRAAREIVRECFDAGKVLTSLIERAMKPKASEQIV